MRVSVQVVLVDAAEKSNRSEGLYPRSYIVSECHPQTILPLATPVQLGEI